MKKTIFYSIMLTVLMLCSGVFAEFGSFEFGGAKKVTDTYVDKDAGSIKLVAQHEVVNPGVDSAVAVEFETKGDWHYYADKKQIPTGQLTVTPSGEGITFGAPVYPEPREYDDEVFKKKYGIYDGKFKVIIPFKADSTAKGPVAITVKVDGAVCAELCKFLDDVNLKTTISVDAAGQVSEASFEVPVDGSVEGTGFWSALLAILRVYGVALGLALFAGLSLNAMPCIWPILPIIIARLWSLSGKSRAKSVGMGVGFSIGILLFFGIIAGANIVLRIGFDTVMPWGDMYRIPGFSIGLSMLMIVMGLFMFGVFQFTLPASVSGKAGAGEGFGGSIGMGFLMALLSTPCGFGVLAAAFVWAQGQALWLATFTIMLIGVGMSLPYILLTSIPGLIDRMPKPGGWMEHIKLFLGFAMLLLAVMFIANEQNPDMIIKGLYFGVMLSLAVWMWGWVTMSTTKKHKYMIRIAAILIAVVSCWLIFPWGIQQTEKVEKPVDWLEYNSAAIEKDIEEGKPVLVKFTAKWCKSCKVIDKRVYSKQEVGDFMRQKGVRAYLGDTTSKGVPAEVDLRLKYKELAIPFTIIYMPDGKEHRLREVYSKETLYDLLGGLEDVGLPSGAVTE